MSIAFHVSLFEFMIMNDKMEIAEDTSKKVLIPVFRAIKAIEWKNEWFLQSSQIMISV